MSINMELMRKKLAQLRGEGEKEQQRSKRVSFVAQEAKQRGKREKTEGC